MNFPNKWISDLTDKDKVKAQAAAAHIFDTADLEAWQCLLENTDYLFSYIKEKIAQNLFRSININNMDNVFVLIKHHAPDWDECIAEALARLSNEQLNTKMLGVLKAGTSEEKAYAAKYFSLIKYPEAKEALFAAAKEEYEYLKSNAAETLGKINDQESYNYFINKLESEDDWEKLEAAQFLSNYGNKDAAMYILQAMLNSGMSEYIAGEVASLVDLADLLDDDEDIQLLALEAFDNIISGIPEIWDLQALVDYKIYDMTEKLIKLAQESSTSLLSGKYAQLLLKLKTRISMFINNSQYTFNQEKPVMKELEEIYHLLLCESEEFWNSQVRSLCKELDIDDKNRQLAAINTISESDIKEAIPCLMNIIYKSDEDDFVVYEAICCISKFGQASQIQDIDKILNNFKDSNLSLMLRHSIGACC